MTKDDAGFGAEGPRKGGDGKAVADDSKPAPRRRRVYAVEDLPDDILEAILAAEPPPEAEQYNWELTADDGPDTGAGGRPREGGENG